MNGTEDLRSTLARHAEGVEDTGLADRATAVRGRVAAARRRRRTAAAAGAVGVAAAVAAVAVLPTVLTGADPDRPRFLAGAEVPTAMTSLGFTYELADGVEAEDRLRLDLSDYDGPVLVSWATAGDDDRVVLRSSFDRRAEVERAADFSTYRLVPREELGSPLLLRGDGQIAAAVYTMTDAAPAGLTVDGSTWRQEVADGTLVEASVSGPGESSSISATLRDPAEGGLVQHVACAGVPADHVVVQAVDDVPASWGPCAGGAALPRDLVEGAESVTDLPPGLDGLLPAVRAGDQVDLDLYVAKDPGLDDPVEVDVPGVRLAQAVYEVPAPVARVAGFDVPRVVEQDGHLWRYRDRVVSTGEARVAATAPATDGPVLVEGYRGRTGGALVALRRDGVTEVSASGAGLGGAFGAVAEYDPDARWSLVLRGAPPRDDTELGLVFYERLD